MYYRQYCRCCYRLVERCLLGSQPGGHQVQAELHPARDISLPLVDHGVDELAAANDDVAAAWMAASNNSVHKGVEHIDKKNSLADPCKKPCSEVPLTQQQVPSVFSVHTTIVDANEPAHGNPNEASAGVVEPCDVGTQIHQIENLEDNTLTQTEKRISQDSSEHKHAGNHLYEDDWTTEETTSTVDRDDFEADASRKFTDETHGDNLTSTAALVAQDIQTPTIENAHWKTIRSNVNGMIAAESLLNEVRANQTEQLYETNWSAAVSSRLPDSSIVGDDVEKDKLEAYAVNTATNKAHAPGDNLTLTEAQVSQDIQTPTIENTYWKTVRSNVNGMIAAESLLNEVRATQTEQLYESNWSAAASSRVPDSSIAVNDVENVQPEAIALDTTAGKTHGEHSSRTSDSRMGAFNVDKLERGADVPEHPADDADNNDHAMVSDNNATTASDADDVS